MRASELIKLLQSLIKEYGDNRIVYRHAGYDFGLSDLKVGEWPNPELDDAIEKYFYIDL